MDLELNHDGRVSSVFAGQCAGPVWRWLGTGKVSRLGVRYGDVLCVLGDRQCKDHSTYSKSGTGPGKRLCGTSRSCAVD